MKTLVRHDDGSILIVNWHLDARELLGVRTTVPTIDSYTKLYREKSRKMLHRMIRDAERDGYIPFCEHDDSRGRRGVVRSCKHGCRQTKQAREFIKAKRELISKAKEL